MALVVLSGCNKPDAEATKQANRADDGPQQFGSWSFSVDKDKMTDKQRGIAIALASDQSHSALVVKCDVGAKSTDLYAEVMFRDYMGKSPSGEYDSSRELKYRVDGGAIKSAPTYYNDSYALISAPAGFKQFAADIANAQRLVIRATSYDYKTVDSEFNVAGAADALRSVAKTCGVPSPV